LQLNRIAAQRGPNESHRRRRTFHSHRSLAHLADGECYADPGPDRFTQLDPFKAKIDTNKKLTSFGFNVTITPATAA
jgi:hypothetical protein